MKRIATIKYFITSMICLLFSYSCLAGIGDQTKRYIDQRAKKVMFIENIGQMNGLDRKPIPFVLFKVSSNDLDMYVTEKGLTYFFRKTIIEKKGEGIKNKKKIDYQRFDIELEGIQIKRENILKELPDTAEFNFFYPSCPQGINGVKQFGRIVIKDIYPGIDWVLYNSSQKGFKYDFVIHPGADPKKIVFLYRTKRPIKLSEGKIVFKTDLGGIEEDAPQSYISEPFEQIASSFILKSVKKKKSKKNTFYESQVGFNINSYSLNKTLIIDPLQLWWSTYFGGEDQSQGKAIAADNLNNIFVTGSTFAYDFPTLDVGSGAYFEATPISYFSYTNNCDVFISKFDIWGKLLWSTFYGGSEFDVANSITCDKFNNIFITGFTRSIAFPTFNPGGGVYYQTSFGGPGNPSFPADPGGDMFILKFDNSGHRKWATYYGGSFEDSGNSVCCDIFNNVYVVGKVGSTDFPLYNPGGGAYFKNSLNSWDVGIVKFNNAGQRLWATLYGGNDYEEPLNASCDIFGNIYVVGATNSKTFPCQSPGNGAFYQSTASGNLDGFILKFNQSSQLNWATYYGGNSEDEANAIACDSKGNVFVKGHTSSADFPSLKNPGNGAYFDSINKAGDVFITKYDPNCKVQWSTLFGGSSSEAFFMGGNNLAIGECDEVYLVAFTDSPNMPTKDIGSGAYYDNSYNGREDIVFAAFTNGGKLRWSTYFGGAGDDDLISLCIGSDGELFFAGDAGCRYYDDSNLYTYTNSCIVDPGGGAYIKSVPEDDYYGDCVIGKFLTKRLSAHLLSSGCGGQGSAKAVVAGGWSDYTYLWNTGSTDSIIVGVNPGTYNCIVTDPMFGCVDTQFVNVGIPPNIMVTSDTSVACGQSIILNASGANTYFWAPSAGLDKTSGPQVIATPLVTTTYTVSGSNGIGCDSSKTVTINVNPIHVYITGKNTICLNDSLILTGHGAKNYLWTPKTGIIFTSDGIIHTMPKSTITYTLTGTNDNGCSSKDTMTVFVNPLPTIVSSMDTTICKGASIVINATGADSYTWSPATGLNATTGKVVTANPVVTTNYTIKGIDSSTNCSGIDSIAITVIPMPIINITGKFSLCIGESTLLIASGANSFKWSPSSTLNNSINDSVLASPLSNTIYTVVGTNGTSCKDSIRQTVTVNQLPIISIGSIDTVCPGQPVTINATSSGLYLWSPSFGLSCIDCLNPTVTALVNTTYNLIVTDINGCKNNDSISVHLKDNCGNDLFIPNIFSPNGDGINDHFSINVTQVKDLDCSIYNRWGQKLCEWKGAAGFWDGEGINGTNVPEGTYYYVLQLEKYTGEVLIYRGYLALVR
jgi:gliding motility-associated-like protein